MSEEDIEGLYESRQAPVEEHEILITCWTGISKERKEPFSDGVEFDGIKDYVDLSEISSRLNIDELTVSARVKSEMSKRMNWFIGNGAQFRMGIQNSKVFFGVRGGGNIAAEAAYVVALEKDGPIIPDKTFKECAQAVYSTGAKEKSQEKIVIYKINR